MTRCVRIGTVLVLLLAGSAERSFASPPIPYLSSVPHCIALVGLAGLAVDPFGTFDVVVRDIARNPIPNVTVVIDFSGCPDVPVGSSASTWAR